MKYLYSLCERQMTQNEECNFEGEKNFKDFQDLSSRLTINLQQPEQFILVEEWGYRSKGPNREFRNRPREADSLSSLYTKTEEQKESNWVMWDPLFMLWIYFNTIG